MMSRNVLKELDGLAPMRHAVLVYDTMDRKGEILFSHLKLAGEYDGAVYVCSEESVPEAKVDMKKFGIDVERREKEGTLMVKNYESSVHRERCG